MSELSFIRARIEAGDRIRFFQDYYGRQWVELTSGWFFRRKRKVMLSAAQMFELKTILASRKRVAAPRAAA